MRAYYVRFLKRMKYTKGQVYVDNLFSLGTITQEVYNAVMG